MRIIAGKLKGLVLNTFEAQNIRPTADRVRESIFNKIQFDINDSIVLDLFGGTGAMSLEFLSRGAKDVFICDNNLNSIKLIKQNYTKAKLIPNLKRSDYIEFLQTIYKKFDIIFLDPPFATDYGEKSIDLILKNNLLNDNGIIVFEHSFDKKYKLSDELEIFDTKKYGSISVDYLRFV